MSVACNVVGCLYVAEAFIEECGDFPVCPLHDAPQTRGILGDLQRPASFWCQGRPIVLPVGPLDEDDLTHRPAHVLLKNTTGLRSRSDYVEADGTLRAENDPWLIEAETGMTTVLDKYNLMSDRSGT